jgi:hypothetical protein
MNEKPEGNTDTSELRPLAGGEVGRAMASLVEGSRFLLVKVKWEGDGGGNSPRLNVRAALQQSELSRGIYWCAAQQTQNAEIILFPELYAEKFGRLVRKWNRTGGSPSIQMAVRAIEIAEAVAFYSAAPSKESDLLRIILKKLAKQRSPNRKEVD